MYVAYNAILFFNIKQIKMLCDTVISDSVFCVSEFLAVSIPRR